MLSKDIACLAVSRRPGGRCVAGIDLTNGQWIRPISAPPSEALSVGQCKLGGDGPLPVVLDIIRINFQKASPKIGQPENWLVTSVPWKLIRRVNTQDIRALRSAVVYDPELIMGYERYVEQADIEASPPRSSLALIEPQDLQWHAEPNPRSNIKRIVGRFKVCDTFYQLPLTDPIWEARLTTVPLNHSAMHSEFGDTQKDTLLTISLGDLEPKWNRHYKLIAGVVEIPKTIPGASPPPSRA